MTLPCTNPAVIRLAFRISLSLLACHSRLWWSSPCLSCQSLLTQFFVTPKTTYTEVLQFSEQKISPPYNTLHNKVANSHLCAADLPDCAHAAPCVGLCTTLDAQCSKCVSGSISPPPPVLEFLMDGELCTQIISAQHRAWHTVGVWVFFEWINKSCKKKLNSPRRF